MAASWCRTRLQNYGRNMAFIHRNGSFQTPIRCENVTQPVPNNYHVRQCSQFALQAEKMDGNYQLKESNEDMTDGERKPKEKKLPFYLEANKRYHETRHYKVKTYQWEGKASEIDPSIMWPSKAELAQMKAMEKAWCPTLQEMQAELEEERRMFRLQELKREKTIADKMSMMPQMIQEWQGKIDEQKHKEEEQKKKRAKLLEEARIKLGYNVDHRSPQFKAMVAEMELEEKTRKKALKKKAREAQFR